MVKSKKLLSLFLAVVMLVSTFTVMASAAYTVGPDIADGANVKYTIERVSSVPETEAGSMYMEGDFYAVTIWLKASKGVDNFTAPIHYNKTLFAPVMLTDGELTYPKGAEMDQDTYYTDMSGDAAVYAYSLGDYMNNTGMYTATGATAKSKALAKCIGLGNSNSAGVPVIAELVSPDHPLYNKWGAGLPENTGVMYFNIDVSCNAKTAYLNTISGINFDTGWNRMITAYFETLDGVSREDIEAAEFGVYTDDCFTVDINFDSTGSGYYVSAAAYKAVLANANVSGNDFIATVKSLKGQIRFDKNADGTYANTFDVRALATISGADFIDIFGDEAAAEEMIQEAGFVFANGANVTAPSMDAVKALVENGTQASGYTKKTIGFISSSVQPGDYVFSCIVNNVGDADKTNSLVAVGYIKYVKDGQTRYAYYPAAQTISFNELYTTYYGQAFPA